MANNHFDIEYLRRYVQGDLSASEMHKIERAAHEDEMLMDIINGLEFEFINNLPNNKHDINDAIRLRSQQVKTASTKRLSLKTFSIAASLVFILGIGTVLFFKDHKTEEKDQLVAIIDENPVETSIPELLTQIDSTTRVNDGTKQSIELNSPQIIAETTTNKELNKNNKQIASLDLLQPGKNIDLNAGISINRNQLNTIPEEVIIANNTNSKNEKIVSTNEQLLLNDAKATLASTNRYESIGQQRAKLSRMNLDPQAQRTLREVLDRQEREQSNNQELTATTRIGQQTNIDSSSSNALAFRRSEQLNKTNNNEDGYLTKITIISSSKETQNSLPINGITNYKNDLILELSKMTTEPFNYKIEFSLNKDGVPQKIKFLNSSNPKLENTIIKYIETKELWTLGKDANKIIFEVKQVKK